MMIQFYFHLTEPAIQIIKGFFKASGLHLIINKCEYLCLYVTDCKNICILEEFKAEGILLYQYFLRTKLLKTLTKYFLILPGKVRNII